MDIGYVKRRINPRAKDSPMEPVRVAVIQQTGGLLLHPSIERDGTKYSISHSASGLKVYDFDCLAGAREAFDRILPLTNWEVDGDTLDKDKNLGRQVMKICAQKKDSCSTRCDECE